MAITKITAAKSKFNTPAAMPATVAINATDGAAVYPAADHKTLVIIESTAAGTATIKAGTGIQGTRDLEVKFSAAGSQCVTLESGAFMQVSGDNKGAYLITGANIKVAAVTVP